MSLLNGLTALGSGLNAFAGSAAMDAETPTRMPLLNSTPASDPDASAPAAQDRPAGDKVAPTTNLKVPAELLPLYQAASRRTGIPIDVLVAQAKQESGFDPNIVSSTGGIGLHQIQPSTARDPGYGMRGIDPATLKDPAVNIAFAADYLKAKAGGDVDWDDPKAVDAALKAYNGGGDARYVEHVRRQMGAVS